MITNKDIRVENGFLIINGDKYPLDGQSPEAIMQIVEDNSDTTPTEDSTAPITSGGVFAAVNNMIEVEWFTINNTTPVPAGGNRAFDISCSKSGYMPLGVIAITGTGTGSLSLVEFYVNDSSIAKIYYRNDTASDITPTIINVKILFVKQ